MHGGGGGGRAGMRSLVKDRKILEHRIKKGTLPRVLSYARPYRFALVVFLSAVVLDAVVSSVSPLLLRSVIDTGIIGKHESVIIGLSLLTAGLAILDAVLSVVQRRLSANIGEGLIYDMRSRVFAHMQEMPIPSSHAHKPAPLFRDSITTSLARSRRSPISSPTWSATLFW